MTTVHAQDVPVFTETRGRPRRGFAGTVAAMLAGTGILVAGWLAGSQASAGALAHPAWFLPAGLWLLVPHRRAGLRRVQDLVVGYINLVMVTEAARLSWEVGFLRVSASVVCVGLAGAGWMTRALWCDRPAAQRPGLPEGTLAIAVGVLAAHALALGLVLHGWYGYGYERDFAVAGRAALCIVWLALVGPLAGSATVRAAVVIGTCLLWARSST